LWRSRWNVDWQGKPKFSEKTCPSATFVHHKIPHDQTRAATVGSRRLTAWAMARPTIQRYIREDRTAREMSIYIKPKLKTWTHKFYFLQVTRGIWYVFGFIKKTTSYGLKKCIYTTYSSNSTHLWLRCSNFFKFSKKNSFVCAVYKKIGKSKDLPAPLRISLQIIM
jgi:hypothetical protein